MAPRSLLHPKDYRIGWICALSVELTASIAMLDGQHEAVAQSLSDDNNYTLGYMGQYNIVMACLPQGEIGSHQATSVAAQMRSTFPNMQIGFMVGIGGGVPSSAHDIRLGDVVVSVPTDLHGGVVQYDHGKSTLDSGWIQNGHLNSPPLVLKTTISKLTSLHRLHGHKIHEFLADMFERHPNLYPDFSRDEKPEDVLFEPPLEDDDEDFSDWVRIERRPRSSLTPTVIHYGLIGSGNQVIKSARIRDAISKRHGGILCFEMEAAGLMNVFPCIVIRGVCDYADAFKRKEWQGHAAAVAAAYTKEVILALPANLRTGQEIALTQSYGIDTGSGTWSEGSMTIFDGLAKLSETELTTKVALSLPYPRNRNFIGREDVLQLLEDRLTARGYCPCVSLFGLGGVGKTQIALEVAYRTHDRAPDCCVFWVSAASTEAFEKGYQEIGKMLQIPGISDRSADIKNLVCQALSTEILGQWLLIVDNSDDEEVLFKRTYGNNKDNALRDYLPVSRYGAILFTTRTRIMAVRQSGKEVFRVGFMDDCESEKIIRQSLICEDEVDDAEAMVSLVQSLHGLPLALTQATAYINSNDITIAEYVKLIQTSELSTIAILSQGFEDSAIDRTRQTSIAATWLISFEQIQRHNALAIDLLSFLATVKNQSVPQSALAPGRSPTELVEAIGLLTGYCFVSRDDEKTRLNFHRLVYLAMRNWLRKEGKLAAQMEVTASRLARVLPMGSDEDQSAWPALLPHAIHVLETTEVALPDKVYINLAEPCSKCCYTLGKYTEAARLQSTMLPLLKQMHGEAGKATLACMAALAESLSHEGNLERAATVHLETLQLRRETLQPTHPDIADSLQYLAETRSRQGHYEQAEKMHRQALNLRLATFGKGHRVTLKSMSYLAEAMRQLGKFSEAEAIHRDTLNLRMKLLGTTYMATMASMSCLGLVLRDLKRFDESEALQRKVFGIRQEVLGPDHPHTLISKRWLADILKHQGRFEESLRLHKEALESQIDVHGPKHPDTLWTMHSMGEALMHQGKHQEARAMLERVYLFRCETLSQEHPNSMMSLRRLEEARSKLKISRQEALEMRPKGPTTAKKPAERNE